ncbi:MAG: hypothetical protein HOY76_46300 [Streptomyces sp.]|nr:hypothetical protein [Streptomyces sp.]
MSTKWMTSLAAAVGLAAVLVSSPAASATTAAYDPPACPKEYFCIWASNGFGGNDVVVKTKTNWEGRAVGGWAFNNGTPSPGYDHVQLYWYFEGQSFQRCLHYNPGPGEYQLSFPSKATFYKIVWRGEC